MASCRKHAGQESRVLQSSAQSYSRVQTRKLCAKDRVSSQRHKSRCGIRTPGEGKFDLGFSRMCEFRGVQISDHSEAETKMINGCELAGGTDGIPFGIKVTQGGKGIPVGINCDPMIWSGLSWAVGKSTATSESIQTRCSQGEYGVVTVECTIFAVQRYWSVSQSRDDPHDSAATLDPKFAAN
jgi:hypothetical protein